jgi:hypothetical protein
MKELKLLNRRSVPAGPAQLDPADSTGTPRP